MQPWLRYLLIWLGIIVVILVGYLMSFTMYRGPQ